MAGFDLEAQRTAQLIGMKINGGYFDFSSGSSTCDVPTTLFRVISGGAWADLTATTDPQVTMFACKVGDPSNGAITFMRIGGLLNEDARFSYWLMGN